MQSIKLYYFPVQARAELIRFIFHYTNTTFEDIRYTFEEWDKVKHEKKYPFGLLPVAEIDGKTYSNSQTIARYVVQRLGLYPTDLEAATRVEELREFIHADIVEKQFAGGLFKDPEQKENYRNEYYGNVLPKRLGFIEELLQGNTTGFLIGDSISLADFTLVDFAQRVLFDKEWTERTQPILDKLPNLSAYFKKRFEDPKYKAYLEKKPKA